MYWYLEEPKKRPPSVLYELKKLDMDKGVDSIPDAERVKIAQQVHDWALEAGKNLYQPNIKEYRFFLMPHFIKAISGGNRSGKTATCTIDIIMQCEGWHPLQRKNLDILATKAFDPWVREWCGRMLDEKKWIAEPPVEARVVAVDFPNGVEKFTGPEYVKWLSKPDVQQIAYDNEKKRRIIWKNKSYVEFMSQDQDLDAHGGSARDVVHFDEEAGSEYWQENMMRVISKNGRMIFGATAVKGISWTEEKIWVPGETGKDPDIFVMTMATRENPVNTDEIIEKIRKQCLDQTEIDIRLEGKRTRRGGSVYNMAKEEEPWVIPRFQIPKDEGDLILAIDPHPRTEHALLWIWVDYNGVIEQYPLIDGLPNLYEVGESFQHGTPSMLKEHVDLVEAMLGRRHDYSICDPMAWVKDQTKDNSKPLADQLNDLGIYPSPGSKDLYGGILQVKQYLIIPAGSDHPRIMTFNDLNRLLWERKNYHWPEWKGAGKDDRNPKQRPVDKDDHMMECERRVVQFVEDGDYDIIEMPRDDRVPIIAPDGKEVDVNFDEDEIYEGISDAILGE